MNPTAAIVLLVTMWTLSSGQENLIPVCKDRHCYYDLKVAHMRTMTLHGEKKDGIHIGHSRPVIFQEDGSVVTRTLKLSQCNFTEPIKDEELDRVITADGVLRTLMLVNEQLPGPQIVVNIGQKLVIKVTNALVNEAVTMHWHGMRQLGSPWMDGAAGISQIPILPGDSFIYKFIADTEGTHFYHTHMGTQRAMGLYGPLIVLPDTKESSKIEFENEFVMTIQDYYHETDYDIVSEWANGIGWFSHAEQDLETCKSLSFNVDGFQTTFIPYRSGLINGRGRYLNDIKNKGAMNHLPLTKYKIDKPGRYKFRVINSGLTTTFEVSVDHHKLFVTSSDGAEVNVTQVDCVTISPGERYDFYIEAINPLNSDNYWIRATTLDWAQVDGTRVVRGEIKAILEYKHNAVTEPTSNRRSRGNRVETKTPYVILNCPYSKYPDSENIQCLPITKMKSKSKSTSSRSHKQKRNYFLNFRHSIPENVKTPNFLVTINGKIFVAPKYPPQMYPLKEEIVSCQTCPSGQKFCRCTHVLEIPLYTEVQMVLYILNKDSEMFSSTAHPIHIHGHRFRVLKIGYPNINSTTGKYLSKTDDLQCEDEHCDLVHWKTDRNPKHYDEQSDDYSNVILKDTVLVPAGGYAVINFLADNPGYWLMHCHMELHNANGMSLYLKVGEISQMPRIPLELLKSNIYNEKMAITSLEKSSGIVTQGDDKDMSLGLVLVSIFLFITTIIALISSVLLFLLVRKSKYRQEGYEKLQVINEYDNDT